MSYQGGYQQQQPGGFRRQRKLPQPMTGMLRRVTQPKSEKSPHWTGLININGQLVMGSAWYMDAKTGQDGQMIPDALSIRVSMCDAQGNILQNPAQPVHAPNMPQHGHYAQPQQPPPQQAYVGPSQAYPQQPPQAPQQGYAPAPGYYPPGHHGAPPGGPHGPAMAPPAPRGPAPGPQPQQGNPQGHQAWGGSPGAPANGQPPPGEPPF